MSNDSRKTLNRGDTVAEIPLDYAARWDSTTSAGMTFTTSEAVGDLSAWVDDTGTYTLDSVRTNEPVWTPGALAFTAATGLQEVTTDFDATDMTLLVVASYDGVSGYDYMVVSPNETSIGNQGGTDEKIAFVMDASGVVITKSINNLTNTTMVLGVVNDHIATDDNDKTPYIGKTALATDSTKSDANSSSGYLNIGWYLDDTRCVEGDFHELIIWDRVLSTAEREAAVDYLSAKWQAGNNDAASPSISTSTERSWASPYIDPQGRALATYTPFNHKIDGFITPDAPRTANQEIDGRFPSSLPNLQLWFRSDHTASMTFDTGDALAGGTVSSWDDITGNYTADTTTSGDAAVTFHPGGVVKGGFPSVEGGSSAGTPGSIECTATVPANNDTGQQRLYWSVGTLGDASLNSSWGGPHSNIVFSGSSNNFATDMVAKPFMNYVGSAVAPGINYTIADAGLPADDGRIHISVWRVTDTGANADVETWYAGLKLPTRDSPSADSDPRTAIGALSTSNFDAEGAQMLEIGVALSSTASVQTYTDTQVDDLIRYLCARYNVDYMPANTPITVGCWSRQTASNALTDCCLWYEPSNIGAEKWPLHPLVAAYHTTPSNFDMNTGADATSVAMTLKTGELGRTSVSSDETVTTNQHMEMENSYVSTETTDFPADTLGMSSFHLLYMDSATTSSSGARCGNSITAIRFSGVSDTAIQHLSSNVSKNWSTVNEWILTGSSYAYDDDGTGAEGYPGATDADPGNYYYNKDHTMQTAASPAATSFNVQNWVNWDIADGTCRSLEHVTYKHPMDIHEIEQLRKYFAYKYPEMTRLRPHLVDADTISHWRFDGDFTDDVGSKTLTSSAGHTAGETPNGLVCEDHTGVTGGLTLVSGVQDADLDTHGAFTWCAAVYLESYPTASSSNWRPFVRSDPPSGGTSSANNSRYKFRVQNEDGTCRYNHQRDNKISEEFTTFAQVPLQQWTYVGVSRSADGTTVHVIIDETVETWTGLTAPTDGGNARFEMLEEWNGQDFDGQIYSAIFKEVETSPEGLRAMRREVFGNL